MSTMEPILLLPDPLNPKLESFQTAVRESLLRRIAEEEASIAELRKEKDRRRRTRAEQTTTLHEAQRVLKMEEEKLERLGKEMEGVARRRAGAEEEAENAEEEIKAKISTLRQLEKRRDDLREDYNRLLAIQISAEARRVQTAGDVKAGHVSASKTEEDFRRMQEQKKLQDLYLEKMQNQIETLEQRSMEYREQTTSLRERTAELQETVRQAETETEKLRREKASLLAKWNTTVLGIAKRDEALSSFAEAAHAQQLRLKAAATEIQGAKAEIVRCQERHDHLTAVEQRGTRTVSTTTVQIRRTEEQVGETGRDTARAGQAKLATLKTLQATNEEVRTVEGEVEKERKRIEGLERSRKEVEDQIFLLCQDQTLAEKGREHAGRAARALRDATEQLETRLSEARNQTSLATEKAAGRAESIVELEGERRRVQERCEGISAELEKMRQTLVRTQAAIDKKQGIVAKMTNAANSGDVVISSLSPLDRELQRVREEIEATEAYCNEAKARWLKHQQELIRRTERKGEATESLVGEARRLLILQEKKRKVDEEIEALQESGERLRRRIEARDGAVRRLSAQCHEEIGRRERTAREMEGRRGTEADTIRETAAEAEAVERELEVVARAVEEEKRSVAEADAELHGWEERVRACREARAVAKDRDGEMEGLRAEVRRMEARAENVDRQTRALAESVRDCVGRREVLVDKAMLAREVTKNKSAGAKNGGQPQQVLLRNRLRLLGREEATMRGRMKEGGERRDGLRRVAERSRAFLAKIGEECLVKDRQAEERRTERDADLATLLQLQTRARWYRVIKEKRYRLSLVVDQGGSSSSSSGGGGGADVEKLREQNEELKEGLRGLEKEFPHLRESLCRIANMIV